VLPDAVVLAVVGPQRGRQGLAIQPSVHLGRVVGRVFVLADELEARAVLLGLQAQAQLVVEVGHTEAVRPSDGLGSERMTKYC